MKKVLFILAKEGFRDEEFFTPAEILKNAGNQFFVASDALKHLNNEISYQIARKTIEAGKKLAAICIAPTILARAGVLKGKRATAWTSALNKKSIDILKENGAEYVDKPVVEDEIITANGPESAEEFGNVLKKILE